MEIHFHISSLILAVLELLLSIFHGSSQFPAAFWMFSGLLL